MFKVMNNELLTQFADAKLVFEVSGTEEAGSAKLAFTLKDEEWFSISSENKNEEAKKIEVPSKYVDVNNSTEMQNWIKKADFDKLLEKLTAAKVPQELVSQLRSMVNQLKQ
jgi:protein-L-isoaspartate O-methyltransferase